MDNQPAHPVVSRDDWLAARTALLATEKAFTRQKDALAEARRALPWVQVDRPYRFETVDGPRSLVDLFGPRSQLFVYHFMLGPDDAEGCVGCSFVADHLAPARVHLEHHDVSVVMVSRAPLDRLQRYRERMGWDLPWVSSAGSPFGRDFGVEFTPAEIASGRVTYNYRSDPPFGPDGSGASTFLRDADGRVFHTYSSYARGVEDLVSAYAVLDLMPLGRNEDDVGGHPMRWVRRHDAYDTAPKRTHACCG